MTSEIPASDPIFSIAQMFEKYIVENDEYAEEIHQQFVIHRKEAVKKIHSRFAGELHRNEAYEKLAKVGVVTKKREINVGQKSLIKCPYIQLVLVLYTSHNRSVSVPMVRGKYCVRRILSRKTYQISEQERYFYEILINAANKHRKEIEEIKKALSVLAGMYDRRAV